MESATNTRRSWRKHEKRQLHELYNKGLTYAEMGELLGRTENATKQACYKEGLTSRTARLWTDDELDMALNLHLAGQSDEVIGRKLNRTPSAIECAIRNYKKATDPETIAKNAKRKTRTVTKRSPAAVVHTQTVLESSRAWAGPFAFGCLSGMFLAMGTMAVINV